MDSLTFQLHKIPTLNRQHLHTIPSNHRTSYVAKIIFNPNPNKSKGLEKPFNEIDSTVPGQTPTIFGTIYIQIFVWHLTVV